MFSVHVPQRNLTTQSLHLSGNLRFLWGRRVLSVSDFAPTLSGVSRQTSLFSGPVAGSSAGSETGVAKTSDSCWEAGSPSVMQRFTRLVFLEYWFPGGVSITRLFPLLLITLNGFGLKAVLSLLVLSCLTRTSSPASTLE